MPCIHIPTHYKSMCHTSHGFIHLFLAITSAIDSGIPIIQIRELKFLLLIQVHTGRAWVNGGLGGRLTPEPLAVLPPQMNHVCVYFLFVYNETYKEVDTEGQTRVLFNSGLVV